VILLDANVLIYAYSTSSPHHDAARSWLEAAMAKREEIRLSWFSVAAFIRITTTVRLYTDSYSVEEACDKVDDLLVMSNVAILQPGEQHWAILKRLLVRDQATANLVSDAHQAALAIEHGAAVCTNDRDFTRFEGLKIINPIAKQ
jgi:uncharacterized protein